MLPEAQVKVVPTTYSWVFEAVSGKMKVTIPVRGCAHMPPLSKQRIYRSMKQDPAAEFTRQLLAIQKQLEQPISDARIISCINTYLESNPELLRIDIERISDAELQRIARNISDGIEVPVPRDGDPGEDGKDADETKIVTKLTKLLKVDEDQLVSKILKRIGKPKRGKDADENKIIQQLTSQILPVFEKLLEEREQKIDAVEEVTEAPVSVAEIIGLQDELDAIRQAITRISQAKRQRGGGGDVLDDGLNTTIRRLPGGKRAVDTNGGGGSGGANVLAEILPGTQAGSDVTLNLSQLSQTFAIVLGVFRNGQLLEPGNSTFGWSRVGNTVTIKNADAGESFQVWYTYTSGVIAGTVYSETPSGTIDNANTAFTTAHSITTVLSFAIGINVIPKNAYSFVGSAITFNSPLGASLAGDPFTIVYI